MKKISALIIIGLLCFSMFSILAPQAKATSMPPVGYWKFDEGSGTLAYDSSGIGNTGTLMNGPEWVDGKVGKALKFDGVNDYVFVPHSSSLDIAGNEISVEFWMKLTNGWHPEPGASYTYDQILYDKGDAYTSAMIKSTGALRFNIPYVPPYPETNKNNWDAGSWYHIAEVFDGTQIRIYVNGVLDKVETVIGSVSRSTINLAIGSHCFGGAHFFNGCIDEFAIYSYARTAEEIWNDYASATRALIVNAKWQDVPSAYCPTVSTALEELGIPYDTLNPETLTLDILRNYDFVFIPSLGPYIPPEDLAIYNPDVFADMVEQYVMEDGSLMFCPGHGIVYGEDAREPPIFDIGFVANYRIVDFKVTDDTHPIMQGPYRTFSLGERIYAHEIDTQTFPSDARILGVFVDTATGAEHGSGIVSFTRGNGKVVASGLQIGWTSSGPAIYNGVPAEEWIKLTKNTITWLLTQAPLPEQVNGIETVVAFDSYKTKFPWSFSIQQNFWIQGGSQLYWAQNIIWVWPFLDKSRMAGVFEIYNYTDPAAPGENWWDAWRYKVVSWSERWGSGLPKDEVIMRSLIEGDQLIMTNDFSSINWQIPSAALENCHIPITDELAGWPYHEGGHKPEIVLVGVLLATHAGFEDPTSGHVGTYLRVGGSGTWLRGVNSVINSPSASSTRETSSGLTWNTAGDFEDAPAPVAEQGLKFTPDYAGETVIPPSVTPTQTSPITAITIYAACPINLSLYDSLGQHIGYNALTGQVDFEIPDAIYCCSEQIECIVVIDPSNKYQLSVIGTGTGEFTLHIFEQDESGAISTLLEASESISLGETKEYTIVATLEPFVIDWEYVFKDPKRGTVLKISTDDKYFQFIAPDKDFGIKYDANMKVLNHIIIICYEDSEVRLMATAVDDCIDFCSAIVWDKETGKIYVLIDKPNWRGGSRDHFSR